MSPIFTFQTWEEHDFDLRKGTVPVLINILIDIFFFKGGSIGILWCACNIDSFYLSFFLIFQQLQVMA